MILQTINANDFTPDYEARPTVKGVIMNNNGEVFMFSELLPGGGVENGENFEEALKRECSEEIGATIEIIKSLGTVIQYRDMLQKKYEVYGFLTEIISEGVGTTTQEDEIGKTGRWVKLEDAISLLENKTRKLELVDKSEYEGDSYQSKLYNSMTALTFLKEVQRIN